MKSIFQLIIWQIINPFILRIKKNNKYKWDNKYTGLNIGCGIDNPPNWYGIDGGITHFIIHRFPKFISKFFFRNYSMKLFYSFDDYYKKIKTLKFLHYNIKFGLPFKNNVIPNIYSSHFLEHICEKEAEKLLIECYRVMKSKAIIRIVVPSIDYELENIINDINEYKNGEIEKIQKLLTNETSNFIDKFSTHKHMYNFDHLKEKLELAGFVNIKNFEFKKGNIIDVQKLDTRENSLYVEAIKP